MEQLFNLCKDRFSARVLLRHTNSAGHTTDTTCAFGETVFQLANRGNNQSVSIADLLHGQPITQVQFATESKIIKLVLREK